MITPVMLLFCVRIFWTGASVMMEPARPLKALTSVSRTCRAFSETGKTHPSGSVFVGIFSLARNSVRSSEEKAFKACRRKRPSGW